MSDEPPWVKLQGRSPDYDGRMMEHAAGLILLPEGDRDVMHAEVRRLVAAGVNPGDVPAWPWGSIFEPEFLAVIKPLAILHPCAWPLFGDHPVGHLVMAWAKELGRPVYVTQDFSQWLFVSVEPFPLGRRTVSRALATPEGIWELLD
jgi:hypothetical protein